MTPKEPLVHLTQEECDYIVRHMKETHNIDVVAAGTDDWLAPHRCKCAFCGASHRGGAHIMCIFLDRVFPEGFTRSSGYIAWACLDREGCRFRTAVRGN